MARLIDADALLEQTQFRLPLDNYIAEIYDECVKIHRENIEQAPTFDAVPVVRCVECTRYNNYKRPNVGYGYCEELCTVMGDEDFCSLGTRREEADENGSD